MDRNKNMFCKFCGKEIPDNSKFCPICGKKLVKTGGEKNIFQSTETTTYGDFWIRLGAYCIDYTIVLILLIIILMFFENNWSESTYGLVITGIFILYNTYFLSSGSTTPGKSLLNLSVVNYKDGSYLTGLQALKRAILQILSTLFFGIGYWNMGKDEKKQTFHDKNSGTVVIQTEDPSSIAKIIAVLSVLFVLYIMMYGNS